MSRYYTANVALVAVLIAGALGTSSAAFAAGNHGHGHAESIDIGQPGEAAAASRTVEIAMGDSYFEPDQIAVKEGETVHFIVKNEGELVHEFSIGSAAMHEAHRGEMMSMMEHGMLEADRVNHHMMGVGSGDGNGMEHDDPNSVLLEPGQSAELLWSFPDHAEIEFACNVPGHYEAGMRGLIDLTD